MGTHRCLDNCNAEKSRQFSEAGRNCGIGALLFPATEIR